MAIKYLCVAEKPSISKSITQILSSGSYNSRNTSSKFIKNYDFNYKMTGYNGRQVSFTVTAVAGHLTASDFGKDYRKWHSCDPLQLFDGRVEVSTAGNMSAIEQNLKNEARSSSHLMIWTDCDREGEHIGAEIMSICRKANPRIEVSRAKFSAIIPNQIHNAARHPAELDMKQVRAVEARIELDLRIGAAFTRLMTMNLSKQIAELDVHTGPCQFPTLGFVVDQYQRIKDFISEAFWYIFVSIIHRDDDGKDSNVVFHWQRDRLFDPDLSFILYEQCAINPSARVTKIAEKLYQKGFLSYPRTETDQYDPSFDFHSLIDKQANDGVWGSYARSLTDSGFDKPREGKKNDKAHPPIHPTAHASGLTGNDKRVYEYITRRFLASCSRDAKGKNTNAEVEIAGEIFKASGSVLLEKNYLNVFPYDKWSSHTIPNFTVGQVFTPSVCELREGKTTPPNLLTEADLVSLMDKHGIGTDATIAEHIHKIIDREYVMEHKQGNTKYLVPSTLGVALVEGYNKMNLEKSVSKPQLRRENEERMNRIGEGLVEKTDVLIESIDQYKDIYIRSARQFQVLVESGNNDEDDYDDGFGGGGNGGGGNDSDDHDGGPPTTRRRGRPPGSKNKTTRNSTANSNYQMTVFEPSKTNTPKEGQVRCKCDLSAKRFVTQQGANKGRAFWKCPNTSKSAQCNFWSWEDSLNVGNANTHQNQDDDYNLINDDELIADDDASCKNPQRAPPRESSSGATRATSRKATSNSSTSTKNGDTCYKCNKKGHWASNCPNPAKAPAKRKTYTRKSTQKRQKRS
ncbi:prokaryotic type I DNA topoisomerase [Wallemia mellicola CBS 633.66]|uniref:DNA topoisomerase n=1 Tax=Wallemia mellicola (strain ATCC MYA-4683 / CBS 633.66) TaxID=671144 RepID=I4YDJ6_WALMC|nr:prokaryotic type I DNA topoisomerase [Wallemia mellicola CBS 633.66]EIM22038.1 prokaryotic type I DNA topoisomerase [Wallemia mellicola CBS 633.66]|eukprot:XP_006957843.1 prokaryotic type I DNA topoisomerase [Wallemia mellicola CBS 633.66]